MALDLAPFGRWTLRDEAAQRRSALRWAFFGVSEKLRTSFLIALLVGTAACGSAAAQAPTGTWIIDGKATEAFILAKNLGEREARNVAGALSFAAFAFGTIAEFEGDVLALGPHGSRGGTKFQLQSRNGADSKFTEIGGRGAVYDTITVTVVSDDTLQIVQGGKEEFFSYVLWKRVDLSQKPRSPSQVSEEMAAWGHALERIVSRLNAQPIVPRDAAR